MKLFIGVDIGGTNIKLASVTPAGRVVARGVVETRAEQGPAPAFRAIHAAARTLVGRESLAGVGIACAGLIDTRTGTIHAAPNLPAWRGARLSGLAGRTFGVPIVIENDATAAAFGEAFVRGLRDLVMITLGTGVGGGIVSDGRVVQGATGFAGEVGHMVLDPAGPPCRCGARGCLEAYAGAYGIVREARGRARRSGRGVSGINDPRDVFDDARRGRAYARATVRETGERLGTAVAILLNVLNPSVVVIGGGVSASFSQLAPHVRRAVRAAAFAETARAARIERSLLGNDAATIGAAMLARQVSQPTRTRAARRRAR